MKVNNEAKLFLLSMVVVTVHTLSVDSPVPKVQVEQLKNATLQCTYKSNAQLSTGDAVYWVKKPSEVEIINMYLLDGGLYTDERYSGRLNFSGNTKNKDISITLSQVTMADNGTYECSVKIRNDLPSAHTLIDLEVLVSPSKPECNIVGITQFGQNINLTCNSVEGYPKPEYSWKSYDAQNQPRSLSGTVMPGILMLKNISADTTGYYTCISKNIIGNNMCNITVAVTFPSMNFALYGGIIGGVLGGIIIIGVIAYCCCCRTKKEKDYEMTETENPQTQPVRIQGPDEEEEEENEMHNQRQPPTPRPSPKFSDVVA